MTGPTADLSRLTINLADERRGGEPDELGELVLPGPEGVADARGAGVALTEAT